MVLVDDAVETLPQGGHFKCLYELHVRRPRFHARKTLVLLEHRGQTPVLQFPQASNKATSPVLSKLKQEG